MYLCERKWGEVVCVDTLRNMRVISHKRKFLLMVAKKSTLRDINSTVDVIHVVLHDLKPQ